MEDSNEHPERQGLHKYLHVSKMDTYFYATFSIAFFALVFVKVANRIFDLGVDTSYISWISAMQIALLWAILAFVSDAYYDKHEKKYKKLF